jgi:hypothetical protein
MPKQPYIQFFTGDWLKDPKLSLCSPATRGIWIDILCAIHEVQNGAHVQGTVRELARLCRADSSEMAEAITELEKTKAADISREADDLIVITCRRIARQLELKQHRSEAGSKGGSKSQSNREQVPEYESEDEGVLKVKEFCSTIGIIEADAEWFFWKCHGNGWKNGGEPIKDWKATLRSWQKAGYLPSQKQNSNHGTHQQKPGGRTAGTANARRAGQYKDHGRV